MEYVSKKGKGKTLYVELSIYPCGKADHKKLLTISCPHKKTRFKATLSDNGLNKFREQILKFYKELILDENRCV